MATVIVVLLIFIFGALIIDIYIRIDKIITILEDVNKVFELQTKVNMHQDVLNKIHEKALLESLTNKKS